MSRKRKINGRDFDIRCGKDSEGKKTCIEQDLNEVGSCDTDFDTFKMSEIVQDSSSFIVDRDVINVVDELSISNSDLLFVNSESSDYESILSENDLMNSVPENINFYNESVTLYSSNCESEILFDHSFDQQCHNNSEIPLNNVPQVCSKNESFKNFCSSNIISVSDNLENIVPNLSINDNRTVVGNVVCNNLCSETENNCVQNDSDNKIGNFTNLSCSELEIDIPMCKTKDSVINCTSNEDSKLNEFLCFKDTQISSNNSNGCSYNNRPNNNNNSSCINNTNGFGDYVLNFFGTSNSNSSLKVYPLHYLKKNGIAINKLSPKKEPDMFTLLVKKIPKIQKPINIKNLESFKVVEKKPHLSRNDLNKIINCIKRKTVPLVKFEDLIKIQNTKNLADEIEKSKISPLTGCNVEKGVQTLDKCLLYPDNIKKEVLLKMKENKRNLMKDILLDRIKKPEPFNKLLLFTFAVNIRSSLCTVLTQEDFLNNNEKIYYYTGIPQYSYFMALLNILNLPNNNTISPFQMLLLTLMKIRLNLEWIDLAYRFGRSVQVAKDTFGITVYILTRCLSSLINWPLQNVDTINNGLFRSGKNLYVYCVKLSAEKNDIIDQCSKIFICLSNSGHPIHFVSKPISGVLNNRLEILQCSGIINGLVKNDIIIFDKNTNYTSNNEEWLNVLSVLSKSRNSFCTQPYNENIEKDVKKINKTIDEIKKYKFLFENITCEWVNIPLNEFSLFTDVVNVVCGLINLCDILPFSNCTVKKIIAERRNMKIMLT